MASTMWAISDRDDFWNPDQISSKTQMAFIEPDGRFSSEEVPHLATLGGKKVLVLIHGFNTPKEAILPTYQRVLQRLNEQMRATQQKTYDLVLAYFWPGGDYPWEYFSARTDAQELAGRVNRLIQRLSGLAESVDIMAHSMGNRLLFEALRLPTTFSKPVRHLFSLAAAVDDESIQVKEVYGQAIQKCQQAFICYSQQDEVLRFAYVFAEGDEALGHSGIEDLSQLPPHVQLVDCTEVAAGHGSYQGAPQIYRFMQERGRFIIPLQRLSRHVRLLKSGEIKDLDPEPVTLSSLRTAVSAFALFFAQSLWQWIR